MFIISLIVFWEIPFELTLRPEITFYHLIPAFVFDLFCFIDIYVTLHTGVLLNGVVKMDKESILSTIPMWRRIVLVIAPLPLYLIGFFIGNTLVYYILLTFKLIRVIRLFDAFQIIRNTLVYISPVTQMITLLAAFLTILHISACIFWKTGNNELPENSWLLDQQLAQKPYLYQYFYSALYISTTILTIGYGDLHPVTFPEVCVIICVEAIGVFFYNFIVANMVSLVANPARHTFINRYKRISSAYRSRGASNESMNELIKYYEYVWERDRDRADFYQMAADLPEELQHRIALALHSEVISKMKALRGIGRHTLEKLAVSLSPKIFAPGDIMIRAGKVSNKMYFVTEGRIQIQNASGTLVHVLDGDCVLGENSIVNKTNEAAFAVAETYVSALELSREDFEAVIELAPSLKDRLASNQTYF